MDVLVAGGAHDDVAEREAGGQMEPEGALLAQAIGRAAVDRQKIGELAAQQFFRLAFEVVRELLGDIGQSAEVVGFPEPAAAAVLELVDELQRLARLGLEVEARAGVGQHGAGAGNAVGDVDDRQEGDAGQQRRLPGNRQRVVSSGDQQFADRSIVNATFNIDRDFGFFGHLTSNYIILRGAITSGEGRNSLGSNNGLAYTGRIELLPFGKFTGDNDYVEGDLEREPSPKLSLAATFSYNDNAVREAGQLGEDLFQPREIRNIEMDALFKYNGWAWYNEYMERNSSQPVTVNPQNSETRFVFAGKGYLSQLSYLFGNNFEIAGRYAVTVPFSPLYDNPTYPSLSERKIEHVELGVTRYLVGHRVKVQANVVRSERTNPVDNTSDGGYWSAIFQVELGI